MHVQKVTDPELLEEGGGYVLTAQTEQDNAVVNVLVEMMFSLAKVGDVSDFLANVHGCVHLGPRKDRNFVALPNDVFALRSIPKNEGNNG